MTVYVDPLRDWGWRYGPSCHMFTDSVDLAELHALAQRIGLRRDWFQDKRVAPHYDLTARRRAKALKLGAIAVDYRRASAIWRGRRAMVDAHGAGSYDGGMATPTESIPPKADPLEVAEAVNAEFKVLLATLKDSRPGDRSEADRWYQIIITQVEVSQAAFFGGVLIPAQLASVRSALPIVDERKPA